MYYGEKLNSISHLVGAVLALVGLAGTIRGPEGVNHASRPNDQSGPAGR